MFVKCHARPIPRRGAQPRSNFGGTPYLCPHPLI